MQKYPLRNKLKSFLKKSCSKKTYERLRNCRNRVSRNWFVRYRNRPLVSIVIPTYKKGDYLDQCLHSVFNQHCNHVAKLEVLLCVNGDNDAYVGWLQGVLGDYDNIRIATTPKKGASAGRNLGIREATGDYVLFLDDDDMLTPGFVREMVAEMEKGVDVACARLVDVPEGSGKAKTDTYVNACIKSQGAGKSTDYNKYASLFSTVCIKMYRTDFLRACNAFDEDQAHTEDVLFWASNIGQMSRGFAVVSPDSREAYIRRLSSDSLSRPSQDSRFDFFIEGRLRAIEILGHMLLDLRPFPEKKFVLNKLIAQENLMHSFYLGLDDGAKRKAQCAILSSGSLFLNKSRFASVPGIAFCHNFSPYVDASAFAASKRLSQLSTIFGDEVNWTVVSAPMPTRGKDERFDTFYARRHYTNSIVPNQKTYFSEASQDAWGHAAFEMIKGMDARVICSRSMWAGSHVAALIYKENHPDVHWYAEFSDPIYMGTNNQPRPVSKQYFGKQSYLNNYWESLEVDVMQSADTLIFTNKNQRDYMLSANPSITEELETIVRAKSLVLSHAALSEEYSRVIECEYDLPENSINIGYFGTFYANRKLDGILSLLENEGVVLHIFTNTQDIDLSGFPEERIRINAMLDHLSFLNLASRMDYLYLNDIEFPDEINPYLPSKLADYLSVHTRVLAQVYPNSIMSDMRNPCLIRLHEIAPYVIEGLHKVDPGDPDYRIGLLRRLNAASSNKDLLEIANLLISESNSDLSIFDTPDCVECYSAICDRFSLGENRDMIFQYYFGLRGVYLLAQAFELTQDRRYIDRALSVAISFIASKEELHITNSDMLNSNLAISERIENVAYLSGVLDKYGIDQPLDSFRSCVRDDIAELLERNVRHKMSDCGIIANKACMVGILYLNELNLSDDMKIVEERLNDQLAWALDVAKDEEKRGGDCYRSALKSLDECVEILEAANRPLARKFRSCLQSSCHYANIGSPLLNGGNETGLFFAN